MMPFNSLPQRLADMTPEQRESVVTYYVGLPLKELRRHQDINRRQHALAYEEKKDRAMENALIIEDLILEAIMRKEFPDED